MKFSYEKLMLITIGFRAAVPEVAGDVWNPLFQVLIAFLVNHMKEISKERDIVLNVSNIHIGIPIFCDKIFVLIVFTVQSALLWVMVWSQLGNKPLRKAILTEIYDPWCQSIANKLKNVQNDFPILGSFSLHILHIAS